MPGSLGSVAGTSATISGPGQLLSNLQKLQAQDPAKFKQVVADIANQLQTASQQAQGPQSDLLSKLASAFQGVANGGSLSQLQPQQHHHHHHAHRAYSQNSPSSTQGVAGIAAPSSSKSASGSSMQQLFANIFDDVSKALAAG